MDERLGSNDTAAGKRSVHKGLSFISSPSSGDANTSVVDAKDGRILRLRLLHFDWQYDKKSFNPWRMEANGQVLEPPPSPWCRRMLSLTRRGCIPPEVTTADLFICSRAGGTSDPRVEELRTR